jgi:hypothetical protein
MKKFIMKKNIIILVFLFCGLLGTTPETLRLFPAEETRPKALHQQTSVGLESISKEDGLSYIEFLSCDELEGRDTASLGERIARRYITSLYKLWGIAPAGDLKAEGRSYEQKMRVDIMEKLPDTQLDVSLGLKTRRFYHGLDVFGA